MKLSDYLIEAVANRTVGKYGKYGPEPNKESILRWCIDQDFEEVKWSYGINKNSFPERNCYVVGPNMNRMHDTNWIAVQDRYGNRVTFWFTSDGEIYDIQYIEAHGYNGEKEMKFNEAYKKLVGMLK